MPVPFVKGDKRINRKGRPRNFDAARALAQSIAHEEVTNSKGDTATVAEAMLRQFAASDDPRLKIFFFEVAFGKVPQENKITLDVTRLTDEDLQRIVEGKGVSGA